MTTKQKVEEVENKIDFEKLSITKFGRTFQVYPWMKGRLFHKLITGNETLQRKNIQLLFRQIISIFYGCWNFFRKYDVWAFTTSAERRLIDGKYYDKSFDYIGNNCGIKMLLIETRLFNYYPYRKIASKYAVSKSGIMLLEEIYGKLILRKINPQLKQELDKLVEHVPNGINSKEILRKNLAQYRLMKLWLKLFPHPKVVFMTVAYTNFGYIRAFKENGIKVVEFQHGIISKNHHAYFYSKDVDPIQFPDYIVSTGDVEKSVFDEENHFPVKEVIPIGSFILDHYGSIIVDNNVREKWKILVTLQDGIIGNKMIEFLIKTKSLIDSKAEFVIKSRRTSTQDYIERYPELREFIFTDKSFYDVMLECDLHMTVYSTTAIEALSLGKQNILVNIDNLSIEHYGTILGDNPYTKIVNSPEELSEVMLNIHKAEPSLIKESNTFNVKQNYKENVNEFLNKILND